MNPTTRTYGSLTTAYEFFNKELFSNSLPPCLITMQRHKGAYGYFSGDRFANSEEITDEIALNPVHFATRKTEEVLATLAHEMVHLWQHHFGKPSRNGYHNKQWAAKMREIDLIPISSEGKETGQSVHHSIEDNGRYALAVSKLLQEHPAILYHDRAGEATRKKKAESKTKYTCPACGLNVWAKPNINITCTDCQQQLL